MKTAMSPRMMFHAMRHAHVVLERSTSVATAALKSLHTQKLDQK
jgi:hypothetical protein